MSRVAAPTREAVGATPRARMTPARRRAVLERQGPLCAIQGCCRPWTEVDHRCALALGGPDTLDNLEGLCDLHHLEKTARDLTAIAKAKRLAGETCTAPGRPIASRGFDKSLKRGFDGKVVRR